MLKKLKRKFVIINLSLVGAVLLIMLTILCFNVRNTQITLAKDTLSSVLTDELPTFNEDFMPFNSFKNNDSEPSRRFIPAAIVDLDVTDLSVQNYKDNLGISAEALMNATVSALNDNERFGYLSKGKLYYMKQNVSNYCRVAFIDASMYRNTVTKTVIASVILFLASMVIVFLISVLLSGMAIKPVKKAWVQQNQFVADASHELKTPLTVILANSNILQAHPEDSIENQMKWVESTRQEAEHMNKLVGDLLFLAKSDGEKVQLVKSEVDFSDLAETAVLQFEPVAFEKAVTLDSEIDPDIKLLADQTQLNQLVQILLDNACKYTPAGEKVFLKLAKTGNDIRLSVSNTGSVIPPEDLPHVFERFYRSDKARTIDTSESSQGGYGLGLSIAKKIVDRHGGTITAESSDDKGTVFSVIL